MHELSEQPATLYGFPKMIPPNELPFHPVMSAPLLPDSGHWIALGYRGFGTQCVATMPTMGKLSRLNILQLTCKENA